MSREIKFRVWDRYRNEIFKHGEIYINLEGDLFLDLIDKPYNKTDRFVIMQFTGLHDKNGKDIYEGDIITPIAYKNTNSKEWIKFKCEVILYKGMFCLKPNKSFITEYKPLYKSLENAASANNRFEIIGNIYENPELLGIPDPVNIPQIGCKE